MSGPEVLYSPCRNTVTKSYTSDIYAQIVTSYNQADRKSHEWCHDLWSVCYLNGYCSRLFMFVYADVSYSVLQQLMGLRVPKKSCTETAISTHIHT